jgi:adenosylcobinamide kinase/adenosylcobinamide-phosphate guanylyltransferase
MPIVLVGGGSRSGKSSFALNLAIERGQRRAFVATAQAFDEEMRERIARHRAERDDRFTTIEAPLDLTGVVRREDFDVLLVDCLTLWVSNQMMREETNGTPDLVACMDELVREAAQSEKLCIFVTNEVGCGIVPANALARRFRDLAGRLNQEMAKAAQEVYLLHFGIPVRLK